VHKYFQQDTVDFIKRQARDLQTMSDLLITMMVMYLILAIAVIILLQWFYSIPNKAEKVQEAVERVTTAAVAMKKGISKIFHVRSKMSKNDKKKNKQSRKIVVSNKGRVKSGKMAYRVYSAEDYLNDMTEKGFEGVAMLRIIDPISGEELLYTFTDDGLQKLGLLTKAVDAVDNGLKAFYTTPDGKQFQLGTRQDVENWQETHEVDSHDLDLFDRPYEPDDYQDIDIDEGEFYSRYQEQEDLLEQEAEEMYYDMIERQFNSRKETKKTPDPLAPHNEPQFYPHLPGQTQVPIPPLVTQNHVKSTPMTGVQSVTEMSSPKEGSMEHLIVAMSALVEKSNKSLVETFMLETEKRLGALATELHTKQALGDEAIVKLANQQSEIQKALVTNREEALVKAEKAQEKVKQKKEQMKAANAESERLKQELHDLRQEMKAASVQVANRVMEAPQQEMHARPAPTKSAGPKKEKKKVEKVKNGKQEKPMMTCPHCIAKMDQDPSFAPTKRNKSGDPVIWAHAIQDCEWGGKDYRVEKHGNETQLIKKKKDEKIVFLTPEDGRTLTKQ